MILLRLVFAMLLATAIPARADEGMWLFNNPPLKQFKEKYQFEADAAVARASAKSRACDSIRAEAVVRFRQRALSSRIITSGRYAAKSQQREKQLRARRFLCEDADGRNQGDRSRTQRADVDRRCDRAGERAVRPGMSADDAGKARENAIAAIEKESKDKTGLRSDVVTLYQGGVYNLYRYKRYDDVRIVFAPEQQMAFYGGDPDNFEYPRFDLDICIFRAYENGQPAKIEHFLKWNTKGPSDGELTFVSGHPGQNRPSTDYRRARRHARPRGALHASRCLTGAKYCCTAFAAAHLRKRGRRVRDDLFGNSKQSKTLRRLCRGAARPGDLGRDRSARKEIARWRSRATRSGNRPPARTIGSRRRRRKPRRSCRVYDYFEEDRAAGTRRLPRAARILQHALQICAAAPPRGRGAAETERRTLPGISRQQSRNHSSWNCSRPSRSTKMYEQATLTDSLTDMAEFRWRRSARAASSRRQIARTLVPRNWSKERN